MTQIFRIYDNYNMHNPVGYVTLNDGVREDTIRECVLLPALMATGPQEDPPPICFSLVSKTQAKKARARSS